MASAFIPAIGPFIDILWAPYAAKKMGEMYEGKTGKIASWVVFLEEIIPFGVTDFIPTFTLMWIYTFVVAPKTSKEVQTIEVEINE